MHSVVASSMGSCIGSMDLIKGEKGSFFIFSRLNWPGRLAYGFYGLQPRISNKIHSEPLMHALSPWEVLVENFFNFIYGAL